ncbi:hypothetical protein A2U01_0106018, partial [Trifolium medium]|nr:hypothetical protein [Trifolium medium]
KSEPKNTNPDEPEPSPIGNDSYSVLQIWKQVVQRATPLLAPPPVEAT